MCQTTYSQVHKYRDIGKILIFLALQYRESEKGDHVKMYVNFRFNIKGVYIQIR